MQTFKPALCIIALITMQVCAEAQAIRAAYKFYYKKDITEKGYYVEPDMMMDYDGRTAAFYSDATYYRDSLKSLAFDNNGSIQNHDAYGQLSDFRSGATHDMAFIDFENNSFELMYKEYTVHIISNAENLETPHWKLHDTTTTSALGYEVKMATADFMGRKWIVWYTEEIPVPAGPWLLWGTPGLIVHAKDSEDIFTFKMLNVDMPDTPVGYNNLKKYFYKTEGLWKYYTYDLKKAEKIHNKSKRDYDYLFELANAKTSNAYFVDKDGNVEAFETKKPHIPLIAEDYWQ